MHISFLSFLYTVYLYKIFTVFMSTKIRRHNLYTRGKGAQVCVTRSTFSLLMQNITPFYIPQYTNSLPKPTTKSPSRYALLLSVSTGTYIRSTCKMSTCERVSSRLSKEAMDIVLSWINSLQNFFN